MRLVATLAFMPALGGCFLTADKLDPALDVPAKYRLAGRSAHAALPKLDWWKSYRSAELTDLMEQAQTANLDIAAAIARIVQADGQARVAGAALLPNINGSGTGYSKGQCADNGIARAGNVIDLDRVRGDVAGDPLVVPHRKPACSARHY